MSNWEEAVEHQKQKQSRPRTLQEHNSQSCQPCGCDEGANHKCVIHHECHQQPDPSPISPTASVQTVAVSEQTGSRLFSTDAKTRKGFPIFTGGLLYFPDALAALANLSKIGNDQHNPGEPLHWARDKSTDQMDTATRHMMDHGTGYTKDSDGAYHLAKAAWRLLAELQLTIEHERESE